MQQNDSADSGEEDVSKPFRADVRMTPFLYGSPFWFCIRHPSTHRIHEYVRGKRDGPLIIQAKPTLRTATLIDPGNCVRKAQFVLTTTCEIVTDGDCGERNFYVETRLLRRAIDQAVEGLLENERSDVELYFVVDAGERTQFDAADIWHPWLITRDRVRNKTHVTRLNSPCDRRACSVWMSNVMCCACVPQ